MMVKPISVEVIAPVLTDLRHCAHCEVIFGQTEVGQQVHREELDEYPQDLKEDFERLSAWLIELAHRYGDALRIKLIDPQSFEGFLKSVRYWVRRYPAFIIAGRKEYVGWDKAALDRVLQAHISGESPTDES
ncbi:MAG: hypothetical protein GTN71_23345 [Anaerolineae bacterium]|nr:hypothetical protein [Anaerolineae bacterium]